MAETDGLQIDLDSGKGLITKGYITDYIENPCTMLHIEFHCTELLIFHPDDGHYFRYLSLEWIPLNCTLGHTSEGTWLYQIDAIPKQMYITIADPCPDLATLANMMGLTLSEDSSNLPIKCPVMRLPAYDFIRVTRLQSFNDAVVKKQMDEAYFIYCNSHVLTAMTWKTMTNSKARSLEIPDGLKGTEEITVYDSRVENALLCPAYPGEWNESDWLRKITGVTYEFKTLQPAGFGDMYTLKFDNNEQMDSSEPMLCFYTECNIMDLNKMTNRFAQVVFN